MMMIPPAAPHSLTRLANKRKNRHDNVFLL